MHRWFFSVLFSVALFIVVLPVAAGAQGATPPTLTTDATDTATLPTGQISDQATLTAPDGTDGNIVFRLYGPFTTAPTATDCTATNLVTEYGTDGAATEPVVDHTAASNPYTSDPFTPTEAGIYQWTAQFDSTAEVGCGVAAEQSVVSTSPSSSITTDATDTATLPTGQISDQATLTAPDGTDGEIVFKLYKFALDATITATSCTAANQVLDYATDGTSNVPVVNHNVGGVGDTSNPYSSASFTPTEPGIYQWTAQFNSTTSGVESTTEFGCGDATEQSVVTDDGGGGGGGNNDNNRNNNDNNRNNNNNRGVARGATDHQYGGNLDIGNLGLGDNPGFGAGQDTNIPEDVIADTIPDGELPFTGGPPLLGLAVIGLACAGLGVSVLRGALRRTRDR